MYSTRRSSETPPMILTGTCPACGDLLTLRQPKTGAAFVGCSTWPRCKFRSHYDATLNQLRNEVERLCAALTIEKMQRAVAITAMQPGVYDAKPSPAMHHGVRAKL
jgi:ssDNA-binding Zn-finger/Zn-ribbon topoisomerase 1